MRNALRGIFFTAKDVWNVRAHAKQDVRYVKGIFMTNSNDQSLTLQPATGMSRSRLLLVTLPAFYLAVFFATVIDAILGQSLVALWSLLLVLTCALVLMRSSQFFWKLRTFTAWLWQAARCSALAGLIGLSIGFGVMLLGDGSMDTLIYGLSLAAFSVLYGVLIALPAGCAVVLMERETLT
jgi:hypothetical protein